MNNLLTLHPTIASPLMSSSACALPPGLARIRLLPDLDAAHQAGPSLLIATVDLHLAGPLAALGLPVLPVSLDEAGRPVVCHPEGSSPLPAVPQLALAAVAFSPEGAGLLAHLGTVLGEGAFPQVTELHPDAALDGAAGLLAGAEALLRRHAALLTATLRSLAELRIAHEAHQTRLADLEAYLSRGNRQDLDLAFEEKPVAAAGVLTLAAGRAVRQLLPVASRGVSALALHLPAAPEGAAGTLHVTLTSLEDGVQHGAWRLPLAGLRGGWQVLGLARGIPGLRRSLRLAAEVEGGGALALSLGDRQPLPMFRAEDAGGEALAPRSLAFRVLVGLPGLPPPLPAVDHPAEALCDEPGFEEVPIEAEAAQAALPVPPGAPAPRIGAGAVRGSVLLDLPEGALAAATLPAALPQGAILAQAAAALEAGEAAEVALFAGEDLDTALALAEADAPAEAGWSGWMPVGAEGGPLRLYCAAEPRRRDLVLLCRGAGQAGHGLRLRVEALRATCAPAELPAGGPEAPRPAAGDLLAPLEPPPVRSIGAAEFRGAGLHGVETSGRVAWRWLMPEVTLELDGVSPAHAELVLDLPALAPGVGDATVGATVNGILAHVAFEPGESGGHRARIALPRAARRGDRRMKVAIDFGRGFTPPGDQRVLAAACSALRLEG